MSFPSDLPYAKHEGTELWKALNKGIGELVKNQDLIEQTPREYIVGYLCKILTESKHSFCPSSKKDS